MLTLIPMVLVNRAAFVAPTLISKVPTNGSFEKALTPFASKLTIMLPTRFVVTDDTHDVLPVLVLCPSALIVRTLL